MRDLRKTKTVGIIYKDNVDLKKELEYLKNCLEEKGIKVLVDVNRNGIFDENIIKSSDFLISLGGDGNLITLCRKASYHSRPVLGVYAGKLGFLSAVRVDEFGGFLEELLKDNYQLVRPFLLSVEIVKGDESLQKFAFNDAALLRNSNFKMAKIDAYINGKLFNSYNADGLILATPAGSTAYNVSAGGPIIYPLSQAFALTPICSHSLTQRPIILPQGFFVDLFAQNCSFNIDGQEYFQDFDFLRIGLSKKSSLLLAPKEQDYFQTLREKLGWGER